MCVLNHARLMVLERTRHPGAETGKKRPLRTPVSANSTAQSLTRQVASALPS
eukprot:m.107310 g.107310  ORF g.107310 m.107310 type:complete len:52 (-) comp12745_c0_seq3:631-786(-)